jgi:hypothetical protein
LSLAAVYDGNWRPPADEVSPSPAEEGRPEAENDDVAAAQLWIDCCKERERERKVGIGCADTKL